MNDNPFLTRYDQHINETALNIADSLTNALKSKPHKGRAWEIDAAAKQLIETVELNELHPAGTRARIAQLERELADIDNVLEKVGYPVEASGSRVKAIEAQEAGELTWMELAEEYKRELATVKEDAAARVDALTHEVMRLRDVLTRIKRLPYESEESAMTWKDISTQQTKLARSISDPTHAPGGLSPLSADDEDEASDPFPATANLQR